MIRLVEYNLTIKQNQQRQPLSSTTIIVRQFVLLYCYLSLVRYAVHGETNESISSIITDSEHTTTANSYTLAAFNKTSTIFDTTSDSIKNNSGTLEVNAFNELTKSIESNSTSYHQQSSVESDHVNTQATVDVPSIVRSDYNQQLDYNSSRVSKTAIVMGSPTMGPFNSSHPTLHTTNSTLNATNLSNNQSIICDRYTFDHQQVAKFFLTTMILLGFCCLLIVIVLILVAYIYRKLSKGRNVKVNNDKPDEGNIEIDTIKDGRFYPIQDNLAFDDDDGTEFKFFGHSHFPYSKRNKFNDQSSTGSFGYQRSSNPRH